jgi:hypothetical protein
VNPDNNRQPDMTGSNDRRVADVPRSLAECLAGLQLVNMPRDEMAGPAARRRGASQGLDVHPRDSDAAPGVRMIAAPGAMLTPDPPVTPRPAAERDGSGGQPAGAAGARAGGDAEATAPMRCPECGEPAASRAPVEPVPWEARGMQRPHWSHTDGSALCPVPGPSGGFQPAQPAAAWPAGPDTAGLDRPPSSRRRWLSPRGAREAEPG